MHPLKTISFDLFPALVLFGTLAAFPHHSTAAALLQRVEVPSSFNPVGSGARALGMGGAFIAVADDATAASWNPGGLVQLESPEISMVIEGFHRSEEIVFSAHPEGDGRENVSNMALNYLSVAYPFSFLARNMTVSLNYQRLFDFTRQWEFDFRSNAEGFPREDRFAYRQDGELTALGLAFAAEITPLFSAGITINRWDDDLTPNSWEQEIALNGAGIDAGAPFTVEYRSLEEWTFEGTSVNVGFLWRLSTDVTVGGVWKAPFEADLRNQSRFFSKVDRAGSEPTLSSPSPDLRHETLKMPMSYGIGIAWQITRTFRTALDVYRTEWDDFIRQDEAGGSFSPITGEPAAESGVDATHQVRLGMEYLYITDRLILPLTAGVFYDPAPAPGNPDDIFGFSLGTGIGVGRFHFDVAYQYRFGSGMGRHILEGQGFSQDLSENLVYFSIVKHF